MTNTGNNEELLCLGEHFVRYDKNTAKWKHGQGNISTGKVNLNLRQNLRKTKEKLGDNTVENDEFLKQLDQKIWMNPNIYPHNEVANFMESLVQKIVNVVQRFDSRWKMDILKTGSFYSQLRVGGLSEFDFMLDMTKMFGSNNYRFDGNNIVFDTKQWFTEGSDSHTFNRLYLKEHLYLLLSAAFKFLEKDTKQSWALIQDENPFASFPAHTTKILYKSHEISLDMVPCVKFPPMSSHLLPPVNDTVYEWITKNTSDKTSDKNAFEFILSKLLLVASKMPKTRSLCFRVSTSLLEKHVFKHLNPKKMQPLRIVKYIFQLYYAPLNNPYIKGHSKCRKLTDKAVWRYTGGKWVQVTDLLVGVRNDHDRKANATFLTFLVSSIPSYSLSTLFLNIILSNEMKLEERITDTQFLFFLLDCISNALVPPYSDPYFDDIYTTEVHLKGWLFSESTISKRIFKGSERIYFKRFVSNIQNFLLPYNRSSVEDCLLVNNSETGVCSLCWHGYMKDMEMLYKNELPFEICSLHQTLTNRDKNSKLPEKELTMQRKQKRASYTYGSNKSALNIKALLQTSQLSFELQKALFLYTKATSDASVLGKIHKYIDSDEPDSSLPFPVFENGQFVLPLVTCTADDDETNIRLIEEALLGEFSYTQSQCLKLLQLLLEKEYVMQNLVTMHHMFHIMLWSVKDMPRKYWTPVRFVHCFMHCLDKLIFALLRGKLEHYLVSGRNILECFPRDIALTVIKRLMNIRHSPLELIASLRSSISGIIDFTTIVLD